MQTISEAQWCARNSATVTSCSVTLQHVRELATALNDVQAAEELGEARAAMFKRVLSRTA